MANKQFIIRLLKKLYCKARYLLSLRYYSEKYKPLIIRNGTSDVEVFRQVFVQKDYKLPIKINPRLIIDGGANVGYTSLWFTGKYPNAKIIAIEPEEGNYKVLEENTKNYKNIERIKAGLWHRNTFLKVVDKGYGEWGFMTEEVDQEQEWNVKAIDLNTILKNSGYEEIDILKLDIEGAEREIFSTNYDWLSKVNAEFNFQAQHY